MTTQTMNETNQICQACKHPLPPGLIDDRCPQCGMPLESGDMQTRKVIGHGRGAAAIIAGVVSFLVFIGFALLVFVRVSPTDQQPPPPTPVVRAPSSTPLNTAARGNNLALVQQLIKEGADVNKQLSGDIGTPLINAAKRNNTKVVELLLKNGADPDLTTSQGTALVHATHNHNDVAFPTVQALVDGGADVNARHRSGQYTALHRAVRFKSPKTVKYLLKSGADPTLKDATGRTPIDWAKMDRNQEMIDILSEASSSRQKSKS